jgi:hypothetical protein
MTYFFLDQNTVNPSLTMFSKRSMTAITTCEEQHLLSGGDGNNTYITYAGADGAPITMDVVRVGPGAMTYISALNSTCGERCTNVMALQSADGIDVPKPAFWKCNSTMTRMSNIKDYQHGDTTIEDFQVPDPQISIISGAIGWTGFNFTDDDEYQYVRYDVESWWSPNEPADEGMVARRIMEFSIEAVAAMDYNGPRRNVTGYFPITAQSVDIEWKWAASVLGLIPFFQLIALFCVVRWANLAIIRDDSYLSTARLLKPVVDRLGDKGCILTGTEISDELTDMRLIYGWREPSSQLVFQDEIITDGIRHVDVLEEKEGFGIQGPMPPGRYD